MTLAIEQELEEVKKQLWGTQQMLGYVLREIGHPVRVAKADLDQQLPQGSRVALHEDGEDHFLFSVEIPDE